MYLAIPTDGTTQVYSYREVRTSERRKPCSEEEAYRKWEHKGNKKSQNDSRGRLVWMGRGREEYKTRGYLV